MLARILISLLLLCVHSEILSATVKYEVYYPDNEVKTYVATENTPIKMDKKSPWSCIMTLHESIKKGDDEDIWMDIGLLCSYKDANVFTMTGCKKKIASEDSAFIKRVSQRHLNLLVGKKKIHSVVVWCE